jgi:hypothetical protein
MYDEAIDQSGLKTIVPDIAAEWRGTIFGEQLG